uniref:Uncharacterized protein n=1 Tax=Aegilops tauschii TaxID=37682 RepID=M8BR57_AEGTA
MANAKLVVMAILVILLQVSTCAVARHHAKPDPCASEDDSVPGMLHKHKHKKPHCPSPGGTGGGGGRGGTPGVMTAKVVDECDSNHGCKTNIVDTSEAVWKALGLDSNIGEVPVTWSDA